MKKLVIREVEAVKATSAAMYGCDPTICPDIPLPPWCPPIDSIGIGK